MTPAIETNVSRQGRSLALWAGVLGAPLLWGVQLQLIYLLVPWVCGSGHTGLLHLLTLLFLLLILTGGAVSWHDWRQAGGGSPDDPIVGGPLGRTRFLGALGMLVSALFSVLIIAQGITAFFFNPCWN